MSKNNLPNFFTLAAGLAGLAAGALIYVHVLQPAHAQFDGDPSSPQNVPPSPPPIIGADTPPPAQPQPPPEVSPQNQQQPVGATNSPLDVPPSAQPVNPPPMQMQPPPVQIPEPPPVQAPQPPPMQVRQPPAANTTQITPRPQGINNMNRPFPSANGPQQPQTQVRAPALPGQIQPQIPTNTKPLADVFLEPYVFDMREGRRNPFKPYVALDVALGNAVSLPGTPLERYELDEIKLVGIMWQIKAPKAMFVDPQGEVHVLMKDDRIGRRHGYIAAIREGEVVIVEPGSNIGESAYSTRILQLDRDQKSKR